MLEGILVKAGDILLRFVLPISTVVLVALGIRTALRTLSRSVIPVMECYLRIRPNSKLLDLVIANFGMGSAYNVVVDLQVDEADFCAHGVALKMRSSDYPFNLIEPGGRISSFFGIGRRIFGEDSDLKPFTATITYEWQPFWSRRRRTETKHCNLDVRAFGMIAPGIEQNEIAEILKSQLSNVSNAIELTRASPIPANKANEDNNTFLRMEQLMPDVMEEMREDLKTYPLKREFILLDNENVIYNAGNKIPLVYYCNKIDDLEDKVGILVNVGLVIDITYNNTNRYVMSESLVDYLTKNGSEQN